VGGEVHFEKSKMLDERWENMKIKAARVFGNSMRRLVYPNWAGKAKIICVTLQRKGALYEYNTTGKGNRG
jgi:hypothetical protein